jgi:peptidoglycan-associated lipoprotein
MFKKSLLVIALVFGLAACSSSKKKAEGDATSSGAIGAEDMSFDARGSDSGAIKGLNSINFGYDQSTLSSEAKAILKENANWLKARSGTKLQIEGHTDTRGSTEYNLALGERRAQAVQSYMQGLGINKSSLSIISYGKERLLDEGDSESAHARNRRANFVPLNN